MRIILTLLITIITIYLLQAQDKRFIHFSVVNGFSTQGSHSKDTDYTLSLNLFTGRIKNLHGLELATLMSQNEGNMIGAQFSGLLNWTKGSVIGYQSSGVTNVSGDVVGYQNAGFTNHSKNVVGLQTTGLVNTADDVIGAQAAGFLNKAKVLRGFQIGLINMADSISSESGGIGLINLYKKGGFRSFEISFADYQNVGLNFKSGRTGFYTIINVGYNFTPESLFSSGFGIGKELPSHRRIHFNTEIMFYTYIKDKFVFEENTNSIHWKVGIFVKSKSCGIRILPSVYYANVTSKDDNSSYKISDIQAFGSSGNHRWGIGLSVGFTWMK